jgi:nucleoside-diphosphate-sugar epimerase
MSSVISRLLESGHEVIGVDNCVKWGDRTNSRDYRFVRGDCCDPNVMRPLLKGVEGVIQAVASLYGVIGFHRRPADILTNDVGAHQTVLRLASRSEVSRVVFVSSSVVYERCTNEPYREELGDDPPLPHTDYGLSKIVGERLSRAYWREYELPFTIWRPFNVFDPMEDGSDDTGVCHVFADFIHRLVFRQQNPLEILGDGYQLRSFVHIREVAQAIADLSFDARTRNEAYNLGRNEVVTMRDLARQIYEKACLHNLIRNSGPLEFRCLPVPRTDVRRRIGSFEKAHEELDWESKCSLASMLEARVESLAEQPFAVPAAS